MMYLNGEKLQIGVFGQFDFDFGFSVLYYCLWEFAHIFPFSAFSMACFRNMALVSTRRRVV